MTDTKVSLFVFKCCFIPIFFIAPSLLDDSIHNRIDRILACCHVIYLTMIIIITVLLSNCFDLYQQMPYSQKSAKLPNSLRFQPISSLVCLNNSSYCYFSFKIINPYTCV